MKNKLKLNKKEYIHLIISFFIGIIFTFIIIIPIAQVFLLKNNLTINIKNKTKIYEKSSLSNSIKKIYDSVISIELDNNNSSSGTGFIYKTDNKYAYILTNEHVINSAKKIEVIFSNKKEAKAKLLGSDAYLDIAVLRIDKKYSSLVATLGNSNNLNLGDTIFTVGTPVDIEYQGTITSGIISGKDRKVEANINNYSEEKEIMDMIQIDSPINSGNSGGPLVNINGEVVGICTLKISEQDVESMGFAIPINNIKKYLKTLEKGKNIAWPTMGIEVEDLNNYEENIKGVKITKVEKDSVGDKANLEEGDIITKIGNKKITDSLTYIYELYKYKAGNNIEISYIRNKNKKTCKITLASHK